MAIGTVEHVKQDAARAIRNLPDAHASWQFYWRDAQFRRAIGAVETVVFSVNVEQFSDDQFQSLEQAVRLVINLIEVHVAGLGTDTRATLDRKYFRAIVSRLETALEGLEQGLPPDPAKRPTDEELMEQFNAGLHRARLA